MIIIICGKSASGKDTLMNKLVESGEFEPIISTTSRPMREGEMNGREYFFVTKEGFQKKYEAGDFVEYRKYDTLVAGKPDTWYYGNEKVNLDNPKDYVVILDLDGAKAFQKYYGKENTFTVFLMSDDTKRTKRAMKRGSFDKTEWDRRLKDDQIKFSAENVKKICDRIIDNNNSTFTKEDLVNSFMREYAGLNHIIPIETVVSGKSALVGYLNKNNIEASRNVKTVNFSLKGKDLCKKGINLLTENRYFADSDNSRHVKNMALVIPAPASEKKITAIDVSFTDSKIGGAYIEDMEFCFGKSVNKGYLVRLAKKIAM